MGERGRAWVARNAARDALARRYLDILERLAARPQKATGSSSPHGHGFQHDLKDMIDRAAAISALVLLSPVLVVIALVLRTSMGSPVLFRQARCGRHGRLFDVLKFRTMKNGDGSDDIRLTPVGRFLRSTSLDELPELWNVLRGEMSLVGPRPLHARYLDRYTTEQARRHEVLPGITGWAQVNGRNAISWEEKFALDAWYVEHGSLWLDFRILLLTVWRVVTRSGISSGDAATMPEFLGSAPTRR
jgi:lipopolysaccharide/colanic/teichoic acid biosynthesis glycosyltransferase